MSFYAAATQTCTNLGSIKYFLSYLKLCSPCMIWGKNDYSWNFTITLLIRMWEVSLSLSPSNHHLLSSFFGEIHTIHEYKSLFSPKPPNEFGFPRALHRDSMPIRDWLIMKDKSERWPVAVLQPGPEDWTDIPLPLRDGSPCFRNTCYLLSMGDPQKDGYKKKTEGHFGSTQNSK